MPQLPAERQPVPDPQPASAARSGPAAVGRARGFGQRLAGAYLRLVEGEFLAEWRDLYHPMDIYQDSQGTFFVTDQTPRITMLNAARELVARGRTPYNAHGMWIDSQGDIYLAGQVEGITKLVKAQG